MFGWIVNEPHIFSLVVVAVFGLCLGAGAMALKGGASLGILRSNDGSGAKVSVSVNPTQTQGGSLGTIKPEANCVECMKSMKDTLPCKEHSGVVVNIQHTLEATKRIEGRVDSIWDAVDGIRDDVAVLTSRRD